MDRPDINFKTNEALNVDPIDRIFDSEWIKTTFLLSDSDMNSGTTYNDWIIKNRYRSSADAKFTTTGIGMNVSVNARPQFTRYCDVRSKGKLRNLRSDVSPSTTPGEWGFGMGRYYSEAIDDTAQRIYMRFGVPQYLFITSWMSNVFDPKRAIYATRGVIASAMVAVADALSFVFAITRSFVLSIGMLALNAINIFMNNSSSRFYSIRPTMFVYWTAVEDILNSLIAKRTLVPTVLPEYNYNATSEVNEPKKITAEFITELHNSHKEIFDENGKISVFGLALKSQRAFNRIWKADYEKNTEAGANANIDSAEAGSNNFLDYPLDNPSTYFTNSQNGTSFASGLFAKAHEWLVDSNSDKAVDPKDKGSIKNVVLYDPRYIDAEGNFINIDGINDKEAPKSMDDVVSENTKNQSSKWDKIKDYFLAEMTEGAGFAVFTVDGTGSVGESFSNSTQDNPLKATLNGLSSKARSMTNVLSGATDIPVIGDVIKGAADVMATVTSNLSFGLANPLLALLYGVNIELPKTWEGSSATFPKASYKMKCATPYGNPMSQLFNIYLPMSMIIAGSFPRGTGSQSYGSPFLCQIYDRGRTQVTLGIVDSVSITRGTSNLPFTRKGQANAIDIDFSVANLDSVMFTPISEGGLLDQARQLLSPLKEDNSFNDYITSVAGLDVMTQVYGVPKLRLALATSYLKIGRYLNPDPAYFGAMGAGMVNSVLLGLPKAILSKTSSLGG